MDPDIIRLHGIVAAALVAVLVGLHHLGIVSLPLPFLG